jgi:hypothetical protein
MRGVIHRKTSATSLRSVLFPATQDWLLRHLPALAGTNHLHHPPREILAKVRWDFNQAALG